MNESLFLPQDVPVSALYIFIVLYALVLVFFKCSAELSLGSRVRSNIFLKGLVARILLSMVRLRHCIA